MIVFLKGTIHNLKPFEVHLDVSGVGYKVNITLADSEELGQHKKDKTVLLYTRVQYSENAQNIFGFLEEMTAELYDFLVNLHGIGPKIVMSILSYCNTQDFLVALESGNTTYITSVPGIGKSKADKILFEAKAKHKKLEILKNQFQKKGIREESTQRCGSAPGLSNDIFNDLLNQSLESLGFSSKEISLAEKKIQISESNVPESSMENIQKWIRIYLKYL